MLAHVLQFVISLDGHPVETVQGLDDYRLLLNKPRRFRGLKWVRAMLRRSIDRKIAANPNDAVRILTLRFGKIENRPYTNSMCTQ